ncbi:hypothetical protein [[Clostridium] fimetarium]|uniref:Uncharacterized protein n=1 Tax=[Clostridium] fimetarium TaxID=99656 RepID=A0A1I0LZY9_9FIRM|nr:hypothetical protein [[Clostridium] fimetarium]SEV81696.1 hypothetical protein SAMN05421659_10134 [[Clostridium] fimetarium]
MGNVVYWKKIKGSDDRTVNMPFKTCGRCNKEFSSGNTYASKNCPECAKFIKNEKSRERVRRYREKNLLDNNTSLDKENEKGLNN